jgi:hypothetical protein
LGIPIKWRHANVLDYLTQTSESFDLYNLDFYQGFVYPSGASQSRCTTALRNLISNQSRAAKSFILVTTFNVRDKGVEEYLRLADDIETKLASFKEIKSIVDAHKAKGHVGLLKLCYQFFCWDAGRSANFRVTFDPVYYYGAKSQLLHFLADFRYESGILQPVFSGDEFVELITQPIRKLEGQVPVPYLTPPTVTR